MPRPSNSADANKPRRRRRRRFGKRKKTLPPENHAWQGSGFFARGVSASLGPMYWLWRTTTSALSWSNAQIDGRGGGRGGGARLVDAGFGTSSSANVEIGTLLPGAVVVCGAVAGMLIFRISRQRRGVDQTRSHQPTEATTTTTSSAEKENVNDEGGHDGGARQSERTIPDGRDVYHISDPGDEGSKAISSPSNDGGSSRLGWSPRHRKMKTTAVTRASGERRLSLYDVLTGEAPLPPPRGETSDAAGAGAATIASGGGRFHASRSSGGGGNGIVPLGSGARRASIFDRIADVVFNEEQKDQDPVDADAVRGELEDEFTVSFREGAMGMTLSMDPDTRDAVVGKIVEQGQAFRAGVQTDDLVIGVGEHTVSSYGTVLAFMNIMGRPIELRFRKADALSGQGGSGGGPISISKAKASGGGGGGRAVPPEGSRSTSTPKPGRVSMRGGLDRARGESPSRMFKGMGTKSGGGKAPVSPISPRSSSRVSELGALGREVASSDSGFSEKMEHGVVVTKYGKKGATAQRVLYLDSASMSVAWRDLDARSPGHRRSTSLTNMIKGKREGLALAHLFEVVAGDDPDPTRPTEKGSAILREHCDESLLERSFALQFKERSLEMTCDSHAEMRQLVTGFRDLQSKYGQ